MASGAQSEKRTVFVSYSHKDKKWLDSVLPQLKAAQRYGDFEVWSDLEIREGERWYLRIKEILSKTRFAVCLVTDDFLASSFCMDEEIPFFLQQAHRGDCELLPVWIESCPWETHPWLNELQMYTADGKPVAAVSGNKRAEVFTRLANHVFEASQPGYVAPPPPPPEWDAPAKEDISHLPDTGELLFGRRDEQNLLDRDWADPETNIVVFKAHGGVGKSTLVRVWTERMRRDNYREAEYVYAWSFYSQGTRERVTSADQFINEALQFFGDPDPAKGSPWDKGERLAGLVAERRTLLLLDGMEPLQSGNDLDLGEIKDPALKTLLEGLAEKNAGLCVISTREEVTDLKEPEYEKAVEHVDLERVSKVAGRALLRVVGVTGPDERLEATVDDLGRHALALNLLSAYLTEWHGGSIEGVADLPELPDVSEKEGRHAQRVMAAIEEKLGEGPEVEWLRVLGLFDAPAEMEPLDAVLAKPAIKGLTKRLAELSEDERKEAVERLRELKLLAGESGHVAPRLDCHPLVRERFGGWLKQERPQAWREGHKRLFEYHQQVPEKHQPDTLEALAPLYAAVGHGCEAGLYEEAFTGVYWPRIRREDRSYSIRQLGAYGADLAAVSSYFEEPWRKVAEGSIDQIKAFLLGEAGFFLRALGRLREAAEQMEAAVDAAVERADWINASRGAVNLGELQLTRGEVGAAAEFARRAGEYADRTGDWDMQLVGQTTLADAQHQAGQLDGAAKLFAEAESLRKELQREYPLLYSIRGFRFCDLLLSQDEHAEARRRATQTLEWARKGGLSLLAIALDHLTLGRATSAAALDTGDADFSEAEEHLGAALNGLRAAGTQDFLPLGLLARAELSRHQRDFPRAERDLREAAKIARRGEMRLHQTDAHLEWARLHLARNEPDDARERFDKARTLVNETGYHRRDRDLAEIEGQL
jgi:hypothetical protein